MESSQTPQSTQASYRMAWTAFIRPVVVFAVICAIGATFYNNDVAAAGILIWVFAVTLLVYQILFFRSVILFTNDEGVWVFSGVFPWSKGTAGVKWRDLEDAVYFTGFWSWALKSYTVRVGHRFTKSSEIVLPHIAHGNRAVEHINMFHSQVLASSVDA